MRSAWELTGANGTSIFSTRQAANAAAQMVPRNWGSAVGAGRPQVREIKLFDTAEEWGRYTGMDRV